MSKQDEKRRRAKYTVEFKLEASTNPGAVHVLSSGWSLAKLVQSSLRAAHQ